MSQSRYCEGCGQPLAPGIRFCEHCGRPTVPGATPAVPAQAAAAEAPHSSSMGVLIAFASVGLVVVVAGLTFFAIRFLKPRPPATGDTPDGQTTTAKGHPSKPPAPPDEPPKPPETPDPPPDDANTVITDPGLIDGAGGTDASGVSDTTGTPLDEARTYLPNPGFKYTYFCNYPDGEKGKESETVGRPSDKVLATIVRAVPGNGETIYFGEHYAQGQDGVVRAWDDQPDGTDSYMPDGLAVGKSWVEPGMQATVVAMGEPIDLGFVRFDDAMLVHFEYEADYEETKYFVPGYGEVYAVTPGGLVAKKLVNVSAVDDAALAAVMAKHAPHAGAVN